MSLDWIHAEKVEYLFRGGRNEGDLAEIVGMMGCFSISKSLRLWLTISLALSLGGVFAFGKASSQAAIDAMTETAKRFLDTLDSSQAAKAKMAFEDDERSNWAYVPKDRLGVPLKDLNQSQRGLVHDVLKSLLSESGHRKVENIISLESVLHALEGAARRDVELYYLSIFGEPAANATWGWRFEGHHLSLNVTIANGALLATAPNFWGANPAEVREGSRSKLGLRTLKDEEDIARDLLASLKTDQKTKAIFEKKAFRDVVTKSKPEIERMDPVGVSMKELNGKQKKILRKLIGIYLDNMRPEVARERWEKIEAAGLESIAFGWAGSDKRGEGHYYRVQGPSFLIEYDNVQGGANHVHAVWRDFDGDFGRDLLKEHYRAGHTH